MDITGEGGKMGFRGKKGVTLTELIVAIAILGLIMVPLSLLLNQGYSDYFSENDTVNAQRKATEILYGDGVNEPGMIGDLRANNFTTINVSSDNNRLDINVTGSSITYPAISYQFEPTAGRLYRIQRISGTDPGTETELTDSQNGIVLENRGVLFTRSKPANSDSDVITINLTVRSHRGRDVNLQTTYRIKPD